jgi:hypothetical protein
MGYELDVVIVNWNVAELLRGCLASLLSAPDASLGVEGWLQMGRYRARVWVVDNASRDDSAAMLQRDFPWVALIASPTNLGFTGGNNLALRRTEGRHALLLNPDTRVVGSAIPYMLDYMEAHPQVAVVGPRLRYGDGAPQSSRRRFPTLMTALMESTPLELLWPGNPWARAYRMADTPDDREQPVDWLVGACLMVRQSAIQQVGLLDEGFFMYSEELDWCRRMAAVGWGAVYLPQAEVIHYEGRSSGQVVAARQIRFNSSKVRYFCKHHGRAQGEFLRWALLTMLLWQALIEASKLALGHKPDLRRERLAVYRQVWRSRLRADPREEANV